MRRITPFILILLFPLVLSAQEKIRLTQSYSELTFEQFVVKLQQDLDIRIHYRQSWVDSLRTPAISEGTALTEALNSALHGSELAYYQVANQVFVFEGSSITTDFNRFNKKTGEELSLIHI